jgi:hypothetical protein
MPYRVRSFHNLILLLAAVMLLLTVSPVIAQEEAIPAPAVSGDWLVVTLNVRNDLELVATATLGTDRPEGWSGSFDINDPQFPLLTRLDLELLAGTLLGANSRPDGWLGAVPSTADALARDTRHDLEVLADAVLQGSRPTGWVGGPPLMRCDRVTQAVVNLLEKDGLYSLQADRTAPDFCAQAAREVSVFIETNLLVNTASATTTTTTAIGSGNVVNSNFTVAFFNRSATQKAGVVPNGTPFTPVSRSPVQFSNMMLIQGQGFTVFVDYLFTSVDSERFNALPATADESPGTACNADWCDQ